MPRSSDGGGVERMPETNAHLRERGWAEQRSLHALVGQSIFLAESWRGDFRSDRFRICLVWGFACGKTSWQHWSSLRAQKAKPSICKSASPRICARSRRCGHCLRSFDENVSRAQFEQFTKQLMNDQTAILGMSWIPRVTRDQRVAHERAAVLDGIPGYRIRSVAPDGSMAPSPEKSEYFPVLYTVTEEPRSSVYGLDLNDGGMRQQTLEHARDSNAISTSPVFTLQSGTGHRRGFFVALPVYRAGLPHDTIEERRRQSARLCDGGIPSQRAGRHHSSRNEESGTRSLFLPCGSGLDTSELIYFHGSRSRAVPTEPLARSRPQDRRALDRHARRR